MVLGGGRGRPLHLPLAAAGLVIRVTIEEFPVEPKLSKGPLEPVAREAEVTCCVTSSPLTGAIVRAQVWGKDEGPLFQAPGTSL